MFRAALISMFLTSTALADTWTVDDDGKADFDNIQDAIDAASDGDEIIVVLSRSDAHLDALQFGASSFSAFSISPVAFSLVRFESSLAH